MALYNIKSDLLGVNLQVESDNELSDRDYFDIIRSQDPRAPGTLLTRYRNKPDKFRNLALKALDNEFFETDGSFTEAFVETTKEFGKGMGKIALTGALTDRFEKFSNDVVGNASRYGSDFDAPVQKAALHLTGLTASDHSLKMGGAMAIPRFMVPVASSALDFLPIVHLFAPAARGLTDMIPTGGQDKLNKDMGKALEFAGLPDDPHMRRRVLDRVLNLDEGRIAATRGQGAIEAWAMSATIGEKGKQFAKQGRLQGPLIKAGYDMATDFVLGEGTAEKMDKLAYLDFLAANNQIQEAVENGAEIAAELGGASGVALGMAGGQPLDPDTETLRDLRSGAIEPDRSQSLVMSIPMSPDFFLTIGASGAIHVGKNFVNRGAIIGLSRAAADEAALKIAVEQLEGTAKANAQKELAKVAGSQKKLDALVAKNQGIASRLTADTGERGIEFTPQRVRIFEALDKAPGPKGPLSNRVTGEMLKRAGITAEYLGRTVEFLQRLPEEVLTTYFMRTMGMTAEAAQSAARVTSRVGLSAGAGALATGGGDFDPTTVQLAGAILLAPGGHRILSRLGKDSAILGKQLQRAQASSPLFKRIAETDPPDASMAEVLIDRTSALTIPETTSQLARGVFSSTRDFGASAALKGPSAFLTRTGLGNNITSGVGLARTGAVAASFPAALGYAVGGPEGAGSALGASLAPLVVGVGLGHMGKPRGRAGIAEKMLGDEVIYKEDYLSPADQAIYGKFQRGTRQQIATAALQNPDIVWNYKEGKGAPNWHIRDGESVITLYEGSTPKEIASVILGHEIAHHIDAYGFTPKIIEETLGSVQKNKPGYFTKFKNGKPVVRVDRDGNVSFKTNDEFKKHRESYLDRLKEAGVSEDIYQRYANDDNLIAREVFAQNGASWYVSGEFVKQNYQGAGAKLMAALLRPLFNTNGMRKFFHKIGLATDEKTKLVVDPTKLFPGLKEIPALTEMVKNYNDEVRGLDRKGRRVWAEQKGNLVDQAFPDELADVSFTAKDMEAPSIVTQLKAGGHLMIRDDGTIQTDTNDMPVFLPPKEVNLKNKQLSNDILEIIQRKEEAGESFGPGHVALETAADGRLRATGRFLDPSIIESLARLNRYNPEQLRALSAINESMRMGDGQSWNLFYYSALKFNRSGRKVYGQIKGGNRVSLPFGIEITKDGNINIQTVSLEAFKKNLEWFAGATGFKDKMARAFGTNNEYQTVRAAMDLLPLYLENHMKGRPNTPENGVTLEQKNFINGAIGRINKEQVAKNPILDGLGDRRSQRQQSYRSRRLDRIGNAHEAGRIGSVDPNLVSQNYDPLMMPIKEWTSVGGPPAIPTKTSRPQEMLVKALNDPAESKKIAGTWKAVADDYDSWRFGKPPPGTKDIFDIGKVYNIKVRKMEDGLSFAPSYELMNPKGGGTIRMDLHPSQKEVTIYAMNAGKRGGGFGSRAYQAVFDWAIANGYTYRPSRLTDINVLRLTTAQLSSALKHGTTRHLLISPKQGFSTKERYQWRSGDYDTNLARLAEREMILTESPHYWRRGDSIENYKEGVVDFPELRDIKFDFNEGIFYKLGDSGNRVPVDEGGIASIIKRNDPNYEAGVGTATAKRAIVTRSVIGEQIAQNRKRMGDDSGPDTIGSDPKTFETGALDQTLYLPPIPPEQLTRIKNVVQQNPDGFTINLETEWADRGYVVAPRKVTEEFIKPKDFDEPALETYIFKHEDMFDLEGSHLGGWYDKQNGRYVLDVVFPIENYDAAVRTALWADQDAIFSLYDFKEIRTKDKNGKPIVPKGFGESARSIIESKPDSVAAYAQEAWRRSSSIREADGETVLRGPGEAGKEAGQPQATKTSGQVGDEMLMPVLRDAIELVEKRGRVAESFEDVFFSKMMPEILKKAGGQVKASVRSLREGARRAIEDVLPFMRENPDFSDFYDNDMTLTREAFDEHFGKVSDEDFLFFQVAFGLTSPGTRLRSNTNEGIGAMSLFKEKGNLDDIVVETVNKRPKLKSSPFSIGSTSMSNKARTLKIFDRLIKEKGSVREAVAFLEEGVPMKELNKFNREMGYSGGIGSPSDVKRIVRQATGQDKLIPRMFIFGPKVGAFTLNSIGRHNYNTIDVWEARFIRSYFRGMFDENTGLPETVDEHIFMTRFTEVFKQELERMTGEKFDRSSLQASRWFFIIDTAKRLGYTKASTNDTVSGYAKQYLSELRSDPQGRRAGDSPSREGVQGNSPRQGQAPQEGQAGQGQEGLRQFMPLLQGSPRGRAAAPAAPSGPNRFLVPATARVSADQLDRFR